LEVYGWILLLLIFLTAIYTFGFGVQTWKEKNKLGSLFIMSLATSIIVITIVTIILV